MAQNEGSSPLSRVPPFPGSDASTPGTQDSDETTSLTDEERREIRRAELLRTELAESSVREIGRSGHGLTDTECAMVRTAVAIGDTITTLYGLQTHPLFAIWRQQLNEAGTDDEKSLFRRYGNPWCRYQADTECNAIASLPPKRIGTLFWPHPFTEDDFSQVEKEINAPELLAPLSLVRRSLETGRLQAVSLVDGRRTGTLVHELAGRVRSLVPLTGKAGKHHLTRMADRLEKGDLFSIHGTYPPWTPDTGNWLFFLMADSADLDPFGIKKSLEWTFAARSRDFEFHTRWLQQNRRRIFSEYAALWTDDDVSVDLSGSLPTIVPVYRWVVAGASVYRDPYEMFRRFSEDDTREKTSILLWMDAVERQHSLLTLPGVILDGADVLTVEAIAANWITTMSLSGLYEIDGSRTLLHGRDGRLAATPDGVDTTGLHLHRFLLSLWILSLEETGTHLTKSMTNARCIALVLEQWIAKDADEGSPASLAASLLFGWMLREGHLQLSSGEKNVSVDCASLREAVPALLGRVAHLRLAKNHAAFHSLLKELEGTDDVKMADWKQFHTEALMKQVRKLREQNRRTVVQYTVTGCERE